MVIQEKGVRSLFGELGKLCLEARRGVSGAGQLLVASFVDSDQLVDESEWVRTLNAGNGTTPVLTRSFIA
jgi:hypothetical protein